jgi:hypothetical protein
VTGYLDVKLIAAGSKPAGHWNDHAGFFVFGPWRRARREGEKMNDDTGDRRSLRRMRLPGTGLLAVMAGTALLTAACGGGSSSAQVASLGKSSSTVSGSSATTGSSSTAQSTGNPTQLLNEWAACMRSHGDTGQTDPTITPSKVIDIPWNPATPGGYNGTDKGGQGNSGPGQFCRKYLAEAQTALRGGQAAPKPDLAKLLKFSECMRAAGISDFPDPTANGLTLNVGGDTNPGNPTYHNAAKLCASKTGAQVPGVGPPPPGTIELNGGARRD